MIDNVTIENFKSIDKLSIDLGRINVFIGANGSGKSNILEAITIGAAAATRKLDNEHLALRGIRISDPRLMRNAFDIDKTDKSINISFNKNNKSNKFIISNDNADYSKWEVRDETLLDYDEIREALDGDILHKNIDLNDKKISDQFLVKLFKEISLKRYKQIPDELENFIIYSPENHELRKFEDDSKVVPIGIYGEGLFKLIKSMDKAELEELKVNLDMIDWFEDFSISDDLHTNEKKIHLKDRYIDDQISFFDQRSANEGFLFLLFYLSILISKHTPNFFGIDNIDNALNPKLCKDLLGSFVKLSHKNDKQVILTTHNPAILDGMDLNDKDQRLFVVYRNIKGITKIKRIDNKSFNTKGNVRLSEAFARGYIGGLNENLIKW